MSSLIAASAVVVSAGHGMHPYPGSGRRLHPAAHFHRHDSLFHARHRGQAGVPGGCLALAQAPMRQRCAGTRVAVGPRDQRPDGNEDQGCAQHQQVGTAERHSGQRQCGAANQTAQECGRGSPKGLFAEGLGRLVHGLTTTSAVHGLGESARYPAPRRPPWPQRRCSSTALA